MANENNNNADQPKSGSKKKWIFYGLGLGVLTGLTFFGVHLFKKYKRQTESENAPDFNAEKPKTTSSAKAPAKVPAKPKPAPKLPAKKPVPGKAPSASPALPKATAPSTASKPIDARKIATALNAAAIQKNFTKAYEQLRNIKNVKDYSAVNKIFSTMFLNGVRQTIVNGLLSVFKDSKQKDTLNKSFRAMGLKYDGKKWSLSGVEETLIITTAATNVWKDPKTAVAVPINMVLGKEVCKRGNFTLFENDKQYFLVGTGTVKPYQP